MSHAANLIAILAKADRLADAKRRNSPKEHAAMAALGLVCTDRLCYNDPGDYHTRCFHHRHGHDI